MGAQPETEAPSTVERKPHDPAWFRQVLGQYPTGVSVITGVGEDGTPSGLVVGTLVSVSLDPPLVGFLPDKSSTSWPKIRPTGAFCVNILSHEQEHLCRRFAKKGGDKFEGVSWRPAATGSPILDGVVAWIDCELEATHDAGDHEIVVGRVLALDVEQPADPLLFIRGGYGRFAPLSLVVGDVDLRQELHLVDLARAEMEAVARDLHAQCVAWALVGDELVLLGTAGAPERPGVPSTMVGARLPAIPPVGATWMAYAGPESLEAWLERAPPEDRDEYRRRVAQIRERGFTVALRGPELPHLQDVLEHNRASEAGPLLRSLPLDPLDFDPDRADEIATLNVPVFGPAGEVELLLGLHGFHRLHGRAELHRYVNRLRVAASAVTGRAEE